MDLGIYLRVFEETMKGGEEEEEHQSNMLRLAASHPRNPRKATILFETIPDDCKRLQGD